VTAYARLRRAVFRVLDAESRSTGLERAGNAALGVLILANVAAVVLASVPSIQQRFGAQFDRFEAFSVTVFLAEYLLRIWTSVEMARYAHPFYGRLRFVVSPMALVDLAAIVPAYSPGELFLDLRVARVVRIIRMLRVFKFVRYSRTLKTFGTVFREKRTDIGVVMLALLLLVVVTSSLMYFAEHLAQPAAFSSIPAAMWWSVTTLTTVGYGDMYPVTPVGKLLGSLIAILGIGFFALPAGLLSAAFADELARQRARKARCCPHCGGALEGE
jgi:voltage-gated potassium channel